MLPRLAVIDPELTYDLPPAITASTGLDALAQVIEPYVSVRANPMTDLFCTEGIRRIAIALPRAYENGADREARSGMSWGSLLGGLVAGQRRPRRGARLRRPGRRHVPCPARRGLRGPAAARRRDQCRGAARPRPARPTRCGATTTVARLLTGQPHATADDAVWWLTETLRASSKSRRCAPTASRSEHIPELVAKAAQGQQHERQSHRAHGRRADGNRFTSEVAMSCKVISGRGAYRGKQNLDIFEGISGAVGGIESAMPAPDYDPARRPRQAASARAS